MIAAFSRRTLRRLVAAALLVNAPLPGASPASAQAPSVIDQALDRELQRPARPAKGGEAQPPAADPAATLRAMHAAARSIAESDLSTATARQTEAVRLLDDLLRQFAPQETPAGAPPTPETEVAGVRDADPAETGRSPGAGTRDALESAPQRPGTPAAVAPLERRRNLATSVWGHLPDRIREQMQQSYHERYLPEYEDLVERYYEMLAEQRAEERPSP